MTLVSGGQLHFPSSGHCNPGVAGTKRTPTREMVAPSVRFSNCLRGGGAAFIEAQLASDLGTDFSLKHGQMTPIDKARPYRQDCEGSNTAELTCKHISLSL